MPASRRRIPRQEHAAAGRNRFTRSAKLVSAAPELARHALHATRHRTVAPGDYRMARRDVLRRAAAENAMPVTPSLVMPPNAVVNGSAVMAWR